MELTDEQRAILSKMDLAGDNAIAKLKADAMTDPATGQAVAIIGKWFADNYMAAGYKRLAKDLIALYKANR
jgi:hypothetical protein